MDLARLVDAMRALPQDCVQGCQAQQQAYAEYSLMAPYLVDKTVFNEPDIAASSECNALPGTEFELWFMRHALSCNNATPGWRQRPLLKEFDPGLATQGIRDALSFDSSHIVDGEAPLNIFVSTSVCTWMTAALAFARGRDVNLYVVPGLADTHLPAPLQYQERAMRALIREVYVQYKVKLRTVMVYAYNSPTALLNFIPPPVPELLPNPTSPTSPVCVIPQCERRTLNPARDGEVRGAWPSTFSRHIIERPLAALDRIMLSGLHNPVGEKQVYICITHSRIMDEVFRNILSPEAFRRFYTVLQLPEMAIMCPAPVDDTPQAVPRQTMWQFRCKGKLNAPAMNISNVTMYPGFKTHNSERGAACSGPLGHRSRIYMNPSRGQTERARAEVKRGERQWLLSRRGAWAALKRMTRRGG